MSDTLRIAITGASRGIGAAIAIHLAQTGRSFLLTARDRHALESVAAACREQGAATELACADLLNKRDVEQLCQQLVQFAPDVLVLNAGIAIARPISETTDDEWDATLRVNLTVPMLLTRAVVPTMKAGGSFVYISSVASKTGFPNLAAYCASKFGLEGFTQSLREEVRSRKIRVIAINPAATDTDIWNGIDPNRSREGMLSPHAVAQAVALAVNLPPEAQIDSLTIRATDRP